MARTRITGGVVMRGRRNTSVDVWRSVQRGAADACWLWTGYRNHDGYGRVYVDGRQYSTHRIVWEMTHGPIPVGRAVLHHCDTPPCCNPAHLFLGTQVDNQQDCIAKGRRPDRKGSKHPLAKLCEADVAIILASNERGIDLAHRFGVSASTICQVRHGVTWRHVA